MTPPQQTRSGRRSEDPHLSQVAKHLIIPDDVATTGWPPVAKRLRRMGVTMDQWQADLCRAILGKRPDGLYAAGVGGVQISIPRQVGKTYAIGMLAFALASLTPGMRVLWTAHRTRTSDETFMSMRGMSNLPGIAPFMRPPRAVNGQQEIRFKNGSRILFGARESGFGRGFSDISLIVFDEAQILTQKALDDMLPATNTAANPLVLRMGTPPKPSDPSEAFAELRLQALDGDLDDGLYVEFGADDDAGSDDREAWRLANPSFPRRTSESAMLRLRRQLSEESFRREALGIWDRAVDETAIVVGDWLACEISPQLVPSGARWCAAARFSPDGAVLGLARAGAVHEGRGRVGPAHTELVGVRPTSEGVRWCLDYLVENASRWSLVVVDGLSGAGDLLDRLRAAGLPPAALKAPTTREVIAAHAMMDAAIREHTMTHLADEELAAEVRVARRRRIGTSGGFGWLAPDGATVAGLDAATLAVWAARTTRRRPRTVTTTTTTGAADGRPAGQGGPARRRGALIL